MTPAAMRADHPLHRLEEALGDAPIEGAAPALGYVTSVGGAQVVAHLQSTALSAEDETDVSVGSYIGVSTRDTLIIGILCEASGDGTSGHVSGRIDLLGEIFADASGAEQFRRGVSFYPKVGSAVVEIGERELRLIFDVASPTTISVGTLQQGRSIDAYVDVEEMVQKHFAIFGSTGSGKSSAVALILREIMAAKLDLRILLIDPHNEYAASFGDGAHVVRPGNLHLPYWLFSFDEIVEITFGRHTDGQDEIGLLAELIPIAKNDHACAASGDRNQATGRSIPTAAAIRSTRRCRI